MTRGAIGRRGSRHMAGGRGLAAARAGGDAAGGAGPAAALGATWRRSGGGERRSRRGLRAPGRAGIVLIAPGSRGPVRRRDLR